MQTGKVKFYDTTKGFGFIRPTDSNEDVFVNEAGLVVDEEGYVDDIRKGDRVKFNLEKGNKGMMAVNVELAD